MILVPLDSDQLLVKACMILLKHEIWPNLCILTMSLKPYYSHINISRLIYNEKSINLLVCSLSVIISQSRAIFSLCLSTDHTTYFLASGVPYSFSVQFAIKRLK